MSFDRVPTPALLLDLDVLERNLSRMADRCNQMGVALRPHIKTHKCLEVAERQHLLGARGITVSTLHEARVFAELFDDITWAFPVQLTRLDEVRELAERITLRLVVDTKEAVQALESLELPLHVWIKVDCGYHRAGVDPDSPQALELARSLDGSSRLTFDGILTHAGHTYQARGREAVADIAEDERRVMTGFADRLRGEGIEVPEVSVGSTPGMWTARGLDGVTEARPGNYAFNDFEQVTIGACETRDCAVTVLASVVSSQPGRDWCITDSGALALSKDPGFGASMGEVFEDYEAGVLSGEARLTTLSQEHGFLSAPRPVGSRVRVLPNHSCLTAACFDEYLVVRGPEIVDRWKIWRGR
ncbi:MAG TPA: alanine racemase [Thermoanaerobaculia bacterium]|jgi:D-serine deaminase-like pyridoxal phosphate-dependent protein|nr:alanine racemase [Thermoanaerobaculia bacterium]